MGIEIERKFLVNNNQWLELCDAGKEYIQGYIFGSTKASVRIRLEGENAFINIKSLTLGIERMEYEYPVTRDDALEMLETLCEKPLITKIRYKLDYDGKCWEIDVFSGDNTGLVVAEIELNSINEKFSIPQWIGKEVSDDIRYYNVNLVQHPYKVW